MNPNVASEALYPDAFNTPKKESPELMANLQQKYSNKRVPEINMTESSLTYAPVLNGSNRNKPNIVYEPDVPTMRSSDAAGRPGLTNSLPKVDMSKYNPSSVGIPRREATDYCYGCPQWASDQFGGKSSNPNVGQAFGILNKFRRRRRRRIYIS